MRFFFFFQAEDGIRDADVTGVQTCALPIYLLSPRAFRNPAAKEDDDEPERGADCKRASPAQPDRHMARRSEERRVGKGVDLGGRRIIKKKKSRMPGRFTRSVASKTLVVLLR